MIRDRAQGRIVAGRSASHRYHPPAPSLIWPPAARVGASPRLTSVSVS